MTDPNSTDSAAAGRAAVGKASVGRATVGVPAAGVPESAAPNGSVSPPTAAMGTAAPSRSGQFIPSSTMAPAPAPSSPAHPPTQRPGQGGSPNGHPSDPNTPSPSFLPPAPGGAGSVPGAGAGTARVGAPPAGGPGGLGGPGGPGAQTTGRVQVGEAVRSARQTVSAAASRGPRRARLQLKRIDPWSVMKFSFAVSLVMFIAVMVATALLYMVLGALGVWDSVNESVGSITGSADATAASGFQVSAQGVIGGSALFGAVNMVLFTALATLGAFIYNVCADLVGGIEVTLAERN